MARTFLNLSPVTLSDPSLTRQDVAAASVAEALVLVLEQFNVVNPALILGDARVIAAEKSQDVRDAICALSAYYLEESC